MPHLDHLAQLTPLSGLDVLDIGAGDGGFAARMQAAGAHVTGVEIDANRVTRAQARHGDQIAMVQGRAEALPISDDSIDLVTFIFSLHHVPVNAHDAALTETLRVLRPGGRLHIVEPLPEGTMFDLVRLVDDETVVRRAAQARLRQMASQDARFTLAASQDYTVDRRFSDLDAFLSRVVATDPARACRLPGARNEITARFVHAARDGDGQRVFRQRCVARHFKALNPDVV